VGDRKGSLGVFTVRVSQCRAGSELDDRRLLAVVGHLQGAAIRRGVAISVVKPW
jgi:hypothetical protein